MKTESAQYPNSILSGNKFLFHLRNKVNEFKLRDGEGRDKHLAKGHFGQTPDLFRCWQILKSYWTKNHSKDL